MSSSPVLAKAPKKDKKQKFDKWEIESMADNIMRAHETLQDPEKMKHVKKHLNTKKKAMRSIDDLIKHRNEKYGPKSRGAEEVGEDKSALEDEGAE